MEKTPENFVFLVHRDPFIIDEVEVYGPRLRSKLYRSSYQSYIGLVPADIIPGEGSEVRLVLMSRRRDSYVEVRREGVMEGERVGLRIRVRVLLLHGCVVDVYAVCTRVYVSVFSSRTYGP